MEARFPWLQRINLVTWAGLLIILLLVVVSLLAPLIAPFDPYDMSPRRTLQPPSLEHLFGTGDFGEDIFSRVMHGARYDLPIAAGAVLIAMLTGGLLGAIAGYEGGLLDELIMRLMDILQGFPGFILAMAFAAALGPELPNMVVAISATNVPIYARLMRSQILSLKTRPFALAAVAVGNPGRRVLVIHLLPNSLGPIFIQASLHCGWAILAAAGLSFIGLGLRVPEPEWGVMVGMGVQRIITGQWWISFFPGLAIMLAVLGFNLIGDGLQDILDPHRVSR